MRRPIIPLKLSVFCYCIEHYYSLVIVTMSFGAEHTGIIKKKEKEKREKTRWHRDGDVRFDKRNIARREGLLSRKESAK